jgi:hypothetical protein
MARKNLNSVETAFLELVTRATQERWEREGRYSAQEILNDIRGDEKVWRSVADLLAEKAASAVIKRQMKAREPERDPAQEKFAFANELPVLSIQYKGSIVSTLRATAAEFAWYSDWYEKRHKGTVKRTKHDKHTLARVQRLARLVDSYTETNPGITVREIIEARQAKLEALRKRRRQAASGRAR